MSSSYLPFQQEHLAASAALPYTILEVFQVFRASLSPERAFRQLSEEFLQQAHASDPAWVVKLLAFSTTPVNQIHSELGRQYELYVQQGGCGAAQFTDAISALLNGRGTTASACEASGLLMPMSQPSTVEATMTASAIRLRNALSGIAHQQQYEERTVNGSVEKVVVGTTRMSADWRKNELVHPDARAVIKANLLEVCSSSALSSEKIRAQLLGLLQHIVELEVTPLRGKKKSKKQALTVPEKPWNAVLVPELLQRLHTTYTGLQGNFSAEASSFATMNADTLVANTANQLSLLKQLRALLMILRLVAKRYADVTVFTNVDEVEDYNNTLYPAVIQILQMLQDAFTHHFGSEGKIRTVLRLLGGGDDENVMLSALVCGLKSAGNGTPAMFDGSSLTTENFYDHILVSNTADYASFVSDFNSVIKSINQCVRFSMKCLWPTLSLQLPDVICDIDDNEAENLLQWRCQQGGTVGLRIPDAGYLAQLMTLLLNAWKQRTELLYGGDVISTILTQHGGNLVDPELCPALVQEHQVTSAAGKKTWCDSLVQGMFASRLGVAGNSTLPCSRSLLTSAEDVYEASTHSPFWESLKWIAKFMHSLQLQLGSTSNFNKIADQEKLAARVYQLCFAPEVLLRMVVHASYHHAPQSAISADLAGGSVLTYNNVGGILANATQVAICGANNSSSPAAPLSHTLLTTPSLIFALEFIEATTSNATLYHGVLNRGCVSGAVDIPHLFMSRYSFQRLAYSTEDEKMWDENPEEFVRRQSSAIGDEYSPKAVGMSLILKLCTKSPYLPEEECAIATAKKQQRRNNKANNNNNAAPAVAIPEANAIASGKFYSFVQFITGELERVQPDTPGRDRLVDACLYAIEAVRKSLSTINVPQSAIEGLLCTHVHRELFSSNGFLRTRAVFVLGSFCKGIKSWSNPESYQRLLTDVLPLLGDSELPVRMQTCFSLSSLIQKPEAKAVVVPQIVPLIEQYFKMMKEMDSDRVISTLRHTIKYYSETLSQWAVSLCEFLVGHFSNLYDQTTKHAAQLAGQEEDGAGMDNVDANLAALSSGGGGGKRRGGGSSSMDIEDLIAASDELIETISTLISSLPKVIKEGSSIAATSAPVDDNLVQVYLKVQETLSPMILHLVNASNPQFLTEQHLNIDASAASFSFLDGLLGMLTTLIEHSGVVVSPSLWPVVSALQGLLTNNSALEYFASISAPIDNMISVDAVGFLRHAGGRVWSVQGVQGEAGSACAVLKGCIDMVLHTGPASALPPHHLRQSEIAAAPRLVECIFTNVLLAEGIIPHPNEAARSYAESYRTHMGDGALTSEEVAQAIYTILPSCVSGALQAQQTSTANHIRMSHTNLYLIAMATTSALTAAPAATAEVLLGSSNGQLTPTAFFWSLTTMTNSLLKEDYVQMRQFHNIALCTSQMIRYVVNNAGTSDAPDSYPALIATALASVVLPELVLPIVTKASEQVSNMHNYILQETKDHVPSTDKNGKKKNRGADSDDEDEDDTDDEDNGGSEDWEDDGNSEESDMADDSQFRKILGKAAEHRGEALGGGDLDEEDDDDDGEGVYREVAEMEMAENQLEDFESWSPIDDFNAWGTLCQALQALVGEFQQSSSAARLLVMGACGEQKTSDSNAVAEQLLQGIKGLGMQCEQLSKTFDQLQVDKKRLLALN